jgi:hypothetical protein
MMLPRVVPHDRPRGAFSARELAQRPASAENAPKHPAFKWKHLKADKMSEIQKDGASLSAKPYTLLRTMLQITMPLGRIGLKACLK